MRTLTDLAAFRTVEEYEIYQNDLQARMREIDAAAAGQPLDDDARSEFAGLQELDTEIKARVTELRARKTYLDELAANERNVERPAAPTIVGRGATKARRVPEDIYALEQYRALTSSDGELMQAYRDGAMFAAERATFPHPDTDPAKARDAIASLLDYKDSRNKEAARRILATGSPAYTRAFNKLILGQPLSPSEHASSMAVGVDATGGFAVPFAMDPTIVPIGAHTAINPYRQACRTVQIVGTDTWFPVTATAVTATRTTEPAASTDGSPAFGIGPTATGWVVKRVHSAVKYSIEFGQDRPDIGSEMAVLIGEAKDTEEENSFTVGAGTTVEPWGMFSPYATIAFTGLGTATSVTLAALDAFAVEAAVPIRHRMNAEWFMARQTIRRFQALETVHGELFGGINYAGVGFIDNRPNGNTGLRLLGYPVWEVPSAPTALTSHYILAALGDPKNFVIVDRVGMNVELIPHFLDVTTGLPTGERMLYAIWRNTARPLNADGMRVLYVTT